MILIPTADLEAGMFAAKEIRDANNKLLLARGAQLTSAYIYLLKRLRVSAVYVEQEGTDDIRAEDVVPSELRNQCQAALAQAMTGFRRQSESRNVIMETRVVEEATFGIVEELMDSRNTQVAMMDMRDSGNRLFQHSVNTAILSTILAKKMGHSEDLCKQLAMGMIFHDCGQLFLPKDVFEKEGTLSPEERELVRQHARIGFKETLRGSVLSPLSSYVVLRHHERMDGTGYPDRVPGEEIHPLARIASVVEAFDAMTSLRPYARSMMPDQAIRKILSQVGKAFDRDVALTLTKHIAIYPTGSAVRLSTGERGIVVSTPAGNTTQPTVRLFYASDGRRMRLEDVDLSKDTARHIVQSGMSMDQVKPIVQPARRAA